VGRLIVGHPFNPAHLVPLVEAVPSKTTDPAVGREIPGFIANRLQAALFREAVYLGSQGIVSEQALDDVVTSSIGMRWAVAGPFRTFHLGPGLEALWPQLGSPSLDPRTVDLLTKRAGDFGGTAAELAEQRDDAEIRLMRALDEIPLPQ
jgi:ketoreductase RED1